MEFLGDVYLEQGQAADALRYYDDVFPKAMALVPKGDIVAELRRRRAECYLLLGRHEDAYDEAKTGLEHCRELGDRYEEAATYRVLALSAAALGNASEAHRWFEQGFAYYDDIETPYEWGKLWMAYGDWLAGSNAGEYADAAQAHEAWLAARDHFERMGAKAKLAEAEARIAAIPPKRATANGHPRRRPRGTAELERRSNWAFENFGIVTEHRPLLHLLDQVAKLAKSNAPVLILGESGTGKELIAQGIHKLSGRVGTFMPINCAALPREVIESELFGYVTGAFTGATREKAGLLEVCNDGSAFLDEIGEMPFELQARLLRFLETGELRRVGATRNIRVQTRVVAATNRDQAALEKGEHLRRDLFYRLAHGVISLPPLRQRGEDVGLLIAHFLDQACAEAGREVRLSVEAEEALREHSWPGNIRELKGVLQRLVILAADGHEISPLELELGTASAPSTLLEEMAESEKSRIADALKQSRNSRTDAAKALGIPRTTLLNKMKRYGLG
jgi:DNA-binding NtrC family response regulator